MAEPVSCDDPGETALERGRVHGAYAYEVQRVGEGQDRYRADFSWSPYRDVDDAQGSGVALARLHRAAQGFDAPTRQPRPLIASMWSDVHAAVEAAIAERPAVARMLVGRDWRAEIPQATANLDGAQPLWTHGDWHPTNLLWTGHEVTGVLDFGLADRTTAAFDIATAIERTMIDWVALRDGGPANARTDQLTALLDGYQSVRALSATDKRLVVELLPLVHVGYELSEIDYFLSVADDERAEEAYHDWLGGHLRWWASGEGAAFVARVRRALGT
ncbi:phosphotransferase [Nocardia camponoti]|uniref:Aminoglycoside phosphotransferase domain-containing protein n=1 Tax=Nocardia camponoti TaxID=1616106 RepID=A0A917QRH8_9NOCA|nr:hypothetical protein GCM10011591_41230 [Nocardia camponoti]